MDDVHDITIPSRLGKDLLRRVPEEGRRIFQDTFSTEDIDQKRGWFYTLLVSSTALFNKPLFRNLTVNGIVLAGNGEKMLKRKKDYADPKTLMASKFVDFDEEQHTQRFSDIAGEPCRMLMPIQGYEKKPLVSLEEAVEPIVEYVPGVKRMVYVSKMKCAELSPGKLSIDEAASITLYSMEWEPQDECLYYVLNQTLRNENRQKLKPWFLFLRLILTALAQLPSITSNVFRGVKRDMRKEYPEGK
ncbi:unnamed protein product, partial [Rotaria magnacalcarata]